MLIDSEPAGQYHLLGCARAKNQRNKARAKARKAKRYVANATSNGRNEAQETTSRGAILGDIPTDTAAGLTTGIGRIADNS